MGRVAGLMVLLLVLAQGCGGSDNYAGLSRSDAITLAKKQFEAQLASGNTAYYEASVSHVAAEHGESEGSTPVWLIGIWNGQADRGDCALVSRHDGGDRVRVIPCATFPKYSGSTVPLPSAR